MAIVLNPFTGQLDVTGSGGGADSRVDDLIDLSGVPEGSTDLGTFTGDIIPDNSNNKEALQSLETAIESLPSPMVYKGIWNATTNTPTLTDGIGDNGDVYYVNVAGTQFTPSISFEVGDKVVYSSVTSKYEKWDMTDAVASIFGRIGAVVSANGDYTASQVTNVPAGNLAATDVQGALNELDTEKASTLQDAYDNSPQIVTTSGAVTIVNGEDSANAIVRVEAFDNTSIFTVLGDGYIGMFGDVNVVTNMFVGGNIGAQNFNLQGIYDATFIDPEIVLSAELGAITFKQGSGDDSDRILEFLNGNNDVVGYIDGNGQLELTSDIITHSNITADGDITGANLSGTNTGDVTVTDTDTIDLTLVAQALTADVRTQMSLTSDASGIKLSGDASTPGNNKYYGTNSAGTKGFYSVSTASAGDIQETSFSAANNQASPADITGFVFSSASVRSFSALVSIELDATSDLYAQYTLNGVNKAGSFEMSQELTGDSTGVVFSITSGGQIQYISGNSAGFVSNTIRFRATTTNF